MLRNVSASPCSAAANVGRQNLLGGLFHELRGLPDGVAGLQVEEHGHAGELIDVVDRLRPDHRMPAGDGIQRHHALAVVALDVEPTQVFRRGALVVGDFQNHLVLIGGLLDQIAVVLRIRVVQQA